MPNFSNLNTMLERTMSTAIKIIKSMGMTFMLIGFIAFCLAAVIGFCIIAVNIGGKFGLPPELAFLAAVTFVMITCVFYQNM